MTGDPHSATFAPARFLANRHSQTVVATWLAGRARLANTVAHQVDVSDGDRIVLHDDCPTGWQPRDRVAVLIHGLAGCHASPYMRRIALKLTQQSVRVFRMDLRGSGAGALLARRSYHAGLTGDLMASLCYVAALCPDSLIGVAGFSLGGNLLLRCLGEAGERLPAPIDRAVAVCPPADLAACARMLARPMGRIYERHFVGLIWRRLQQRRRVIPDMPWGRLVRQPRRLREFDDLYTTPVGGFAGVDHYYQNCSALPVLPRISVPTTLLIAEDDPVVDAATFDSLALPNHLRLHTVARGGHLGFLGRRGPDPDWHWMDWRCLEWLVPRPESQ